MRKAGSAAGRILLTSVPMRRRAYAGTRLLTSGPIGRGGYAGTLLLATVLMGGWTGVAQAQRPPVDTSGWPSLRMAAQSSLPSTLFGEESHLTTVQMELVLRSGWAPFVGVGSLRHLAEACGAANKACSPARPPWGVVLGSNHRLLSPRANADRDQRLIPYFGATVTIPVRSDPRFPRGWIQAGADFRLADGWNLRGELQSRQTGTVPVSGAVGLRIAVP